MFVAPPTISQYVAISALNYDNYLKNIVRGYKENMNLFDFTISEKDMNLLHGLARNYRAVPCALGTSHQIDLPSRHGVNGLELI